MPKKNLRLIPSSIKTRLKQLKDRNLVAGGSRYYSAKELSEGILKHLGIEMKNGAPQYPESVIPPSVRGKYSDRNVNGEEIVRKDLEMETHFNAIESPNWGDSYNGTHTVYLPYKAYPRDFIAPALTRLKIKCQNPLPGLDGYLLVFEVDRVLDRKKKGFENDLLICLNLLQENVGFCGLQPSGATFEDYMQTLRVAWDVLPPGSREDAVARLFKGRTPTPEEKKAVEERYDFLISLRPQKLVYGTSGLERYFGGLIQDDLVVFENIQYGNAIYIMFENWEDLSQRSRTELQSGRFGQNFERVTHKKGWKGTVREVIDERLKGRTS